MMRVLQLHNRYRERGGEDRVVLAEAEVLRDAGHEVVVYQVDNPGDWRRAAARLAVTPWNPVEAGRVAKLAGRVRPHVAHVHNTWFSLSPSVAGALARRAIPVVATLHNYRLLCANGQLFRCGRVCEECLGTHLLRGIKHRCYRNGVLPSALVVASLSAGRMLRSWERSVTLFVTMNEFARRLFVQAGLAEERIAVKPHFVEDPGERHARAASSDTVLYVGRLSPEKGLRTLLDAWAANRPGGLRLQVIGDGPMRAELEARAVPGVELVGWLDPAEVRARMLAARALVFPSQWYETFGLALVEGMAAGLPALASAIGGIVELVEGGAGWLVPPGGSAAWEEALPTLADDGEIEAAGARARSRYLARFSPAQGLANLERLYRLAATTRG
jgi:glycosyltransferase involved in cell wall biosynthesis